MKYRKYPMNLFIFGLILNLLKTWYLAAIAVLIYIFHNIIPLIPFWPGLIILSTWLILALYKQLKYRKAILSRSNNKEVNDLFDKVFDINNSNWRKTLMDDINDKIKENMDTDK